jgi:hypothetical protein
MYRADLSLLQVGRSRTLELKLMPAAGRETMIRYRLITFRNADVAEPLKGRMIGQLRTDLEQSIRETTRLLELNPDLDYRDMIFDQPVLGRITFCNCFESWRSMSYATRIKSPTYFSYRS